MSAIPRLQKELKELNKDPPFTCSAGLIKNDDFYNWQVTIQAPDDSPYSGGLYLLHVTFTKEYPIEPPEIFFKTKIYHPNISDYNGSLCVDIIQKQWTPALTISKILSSICSLLNNPNPTSPLNSEAAQYYKYDRRKYDDVARQWTKNYAL